MRRNGIWLGGVIGALSTAALGIIGYVALSERGVVPPINLEGSDVGNLAALECKVNPAESKVIPFEIKGKPVNLGFGVIAKRKGKELNLVAPQGVERRAKGGLTGVGSDGRRLDVTLDGTNGEATIPCKAPVEGTPAPESAGQAERRG